MKQRIIHRLFFSRCVCWPSFCSGYDFIWKHLRIHDVEHYWRNLLTEYGKVASWKVVRDPSFIRIKTKKWTAVIAANWFAEKLTFCQHARTRTPTRFLYVLVMIIELFYGMLISMYWIFSTENAFLISSLILTNWSSSLTCTSTELQYFFFFFFFFCIYNINLVKDVCIALHWLHLARLMKKRMRCCAERTTTQSRWYRKEITKCHVGFLLFHLCFEPVDGDRQWWGTRACVSWSTSITVTCARNRHPGQSFQRAGWQAEWLLLNLGTVVLEAFAAIRKPQ